MQEFTRRIPYGFKFAVCLILSLCLCVEPPLYGHVPSSEMSPAAESPGQLSAFMAALEKIAEVKDLFVPGNDHPDLESILGDPSQKLIVYLLDAHGSFEAQVRISQILRLISQKAAIERPRIALEGTEAVPLDHRALSLFPDRQVRVRTALNFINCGQMDGADLYIARDNPHAELFGVDDLDLVLENVRSYREFQTIKDKAIASLVRLQEAVTILKRKIYNSKLRYFDRLVRDYEKNTSRFEKVFYQLLPLAREHGIDPAEYTALEYLAKLQKKTSDQIAGSPEDSRWLEQNGRRVWTDMHKLIAAIWESLLDYSEACDVRRLDRAVSFYERLFEFKLLPEDEATRLSDPSSYEADTLKKIISRYYFLLRPKRLRPAAEDYRAIDRAVQEALAFYESVAKRDKPMLDHLVRIAEQGGPSKTFLIAGGFHEASLAAALRGRGKAYVILSPAIKSPETGSAREAAYWRLLDGTSGMNGDRAPAMTAMHLKLRSGWAVPGYASSVERAQIRMFEHLRLKTVHSRPLSADFRKRLEDYLSNMASMIPVRTAMAGLPGDLYSGLRPETRDKPDTGGSTPSRSKGEPVATIQLSSAGRIDARTVFFGVAEALSQALQPQHRAYAWEKMHPFYDWLWDHIFREDPAVALDVTSFATQGSRIEAFSQLLRSALSITIIQKETETTERPMQTRRTEETSSRLKIYVTPGSFKAIAEAEPLYGQLTLPLEFFKCFIIPLFGESSAALAAEARPDFFAIATKFLENFLPVTATDDVAGTMDYEGKRRPETSMKQFAETLSQTFQDQKLVRMISKVAGVRDAGGSVSLEQSPQTAVSPATDSLHSAVEAKWRRYLLEVLHSYQKVGKGGFGAVYVGPHIDAFEDETKKDSRVAVKIFRPRYEGPFDAVSLERIRREADFLVQLGVHGLTPEFVQRIELDDMGDGQGPIIALLMGEVAGDSLAKLIQNGRKVSRSRFRELAFQIGSLLWTPEPLLRMPWPRSKRGKGRERGLHELGIIHRDLKPQNIMRDGRTGKLLLVDLGLGHRLSGEDMNDLDPLDAEASAKTAGTVSPTPDLTRADVFIGSPNYMRSTPELEQSKTDKRTVSGDLFALGVTLFELRTGNVPVRTDSDENELLDLWKILAANAGNRYHYPAYVPEKERYIISKLMALPKNFQNSSSWHRFAADNGLLEQYPNMKQAMRDLRALRYGLPLPTAPPLIDLPILRHWFKDYSLVTKKPDELMTWREKHRRLIPSSLFWTTAAAMTWLLTLAIQLGGWMMDLYQERQISRSFPPPAAAPAEDVESQPEPARFKKPNVSGASTAAFYTTNPVQVRATLNVDGKQEEINVPLKHLQDGEYTVHFHLARTLEGALTVLESLEVPPTDKDIENSADVAVNVRVDAAAAAVKMHTGLVRWDGSTALQTATVITADPKDKSAGRKLVYVKDPMRELARDQMAYTLYTVTDMKHPFYPANYGKQHPDDPLFLTYWFARTTLGRAGQAAWAFLDENQYSVFPSLDRRVRIKGKIMFKEPKAAAAFGFYDLGSVPEGEKPAVTFLAVRFDQDRIYYADGIRMVPGETTNAEYFEQVNAAIALPANLAKQGLTPYERTIPETGEKVLDVEFDKPARGETVDGVTYDGKTMIAFLVRTSDGKREKIREFPLDPRRRYRFGIYESGDPLAVMTGGIEIEHEAVPKASPVLRAEHRRQSFIADALSPKSGLVFLPLETIDAFIGTNYLAVPGLRLIFLASSREEAKKAEHIYSPQMSIYNFKIFELPGAEREAGLTPTKIALLRRRAAGALETARPVFILDADSRISVRGVDAGTAVFLKADSAGLRDDATYRAAHLLAAAGLSKKTNDILQGFSPNPDGWSYSLSRTLFGFLAGEMKRIFEFMRSA